MHLLSSPVPNSTSSRSDEDSETAVLPPAADLSSGPWYLPLLCHLACWHPPMSAEAIWNQVASAQSRPDSASMWIITNLVQARRLLANIMLCQARWGLKELRHDL